MRHTSQPIFADIRPARDGRGRRRALIRCVAVALVASLLPLVPAAAASEEPRHLAPDGVALDDHGGEVRYRPWTQRMNPKLAPRPVHWPAAGSARVGVPLAASRDRETDAGARAGDLPVRVADLVSAGVPVAAPVDVRILDRAGLPADWRDAVVLDVRGAAATRLDAATVTVDYAGFRNAFGGEWASRLRLWRVPACALVKEVTAICNATLLPSRNETSRSTVTGRVPLAGDGTLVALAAVAAGAGGDFAATSLSASSTWSAGGNSGAFSWSYPLRVPPAIAGPQPAIAISYSSASVDGRSEVSNNQPSWIGEGFDYWPGYIERRYVPCGEDRSGDNNNAEKTGDLCWATHEEPCATGTCKRYENATLSLNGSGSELVFQSGKGWHSRTEDGSRIEKLTGGSNQDDNGEYWRVTAADGTQYYFGLHSLPGQSGVTNSTWTAPVAGNHGGEPCRASAFTSSFCTQAWRWNLDYVVDPRGNTTSLFYERETNQYARNNTDSDNQSYVRGGHLTRIDYGTWDRGSGDRSVSPVARVVFEPGDRCLSACAEHDEDHWPDVPWDQECAASADSCARKYAPTFWSTKRLKKITTRVWDTTKATPAWQDVESWTFAHSFPAPGDGSDHAGLWLDSIVHAGHVNGTVTMPPVTFAPVAMPNRVLTRTNTTSNWQRLESIVSETGAMIDVTYSEPECTSGNTPTPHTNSRRCYPVITVDPADIEGEDLITEWWHKYVVTAVAESDLQIEGGHQAPPAFTSYEYVGGAAWHYADDDGLIKKNRKTWSDYRGYETVRTRTGSTPGRQTLTVTKYLRGLHGDRSSPSGGTRSIAVPAGIGSETVFDEDQFAGMTREETVYNGVESKPVSRKVMVPWRSPPTASRTINGDTVTAGFVDTRATYTATALGVDGARGWRTVRAVNTFDDTYGTVNTSQTDGDMAVPGDEQCTTYAYNRNTAKNITRTIRQATTTALPCGTAPTAPDHVISDTRNYFDLATSLTTAPAYGSISRIEELKDWTASAGTTWQTTKQVTFDAFGRELTTTDVRNVVSTNEYTPRSGGPVTRVTAKLGAPFDWPLSTTDIAPYWGEATRVTDANGRVTEAEYDPLGRVTRSWHAGWTRADHPDEPSSRYTYVISPTRSAYPYTTSTTLHAGGGAVASYQILDSLLRPRQTQVAAVGGGRVVGDGIYDDRGLRSVSYPDHAEPGTPSGTLWWEPEWSLPAVNRTDHDNAGRPVAEVLLAGDGVTNLVEKWRTTTRYEGDLTRVTPPRGGVATTTVTDALGRVTELRQHTTASGVDGPADVTRYTYDSRGLLRKVADPGRNEWTFTYDVQGRQTRADDPDNGRTVTEYNDFDEPFRITDGRGEVLVRTFDKLGRVTALYDDVVSAATMRAKWTFDRLYTGQTARGLLTEAVRYEPPGSANEYTWQARGFDANYQPTGVNVVIPPVEGTGLAGTWVFGYGYSPRDGTQLSVGYPQGGGLPAETVTTTFHEGTGLPASLQTNATGVGTYVLGRQYTPFGEPTVTTRKTSGGVYVEQAAYYETATRRVTRTVVQPETAAGAVADRHYDYAPSGNIESIRDVPQVGAADKQCFRYDELRRLRRAWTPAATTACTTEPTVAGLAGSAPYWLDWTYDTVGNRTGETQHTASGDTTRSYAVPTSGPGVVRPHGVTSVSTSVSGMPGVTTRYAYDASGNTTCRPAGTAANTCPAGAGSQILSWNAEGQLSTVTSGAQSVETNIHSANGERLIRRDATGTTLYLPGMELRREGNSVQATRYYSFNGELCAVRTPAGLTWVFSDHQGTQDLAVNAATQQVQARRQTPYGGPRGTLPAWSNPRGFVGGDNDPTGLVRIGARHYDAGLGRFVSVDPVMDLTDPAQWNAYSYGGNNPVTDSDPSGLTRCDYGDCNPGDVSTGNVFPTAQAAKPGRTSRGDDAKECRRSPHACGKNRDNGYQMHSTHVGKTSVIVIYDPWGEIVLIYIDGYLLPEPTQDPWTLAEEMNNRLKTTPNTGDAQLRTMVALSLACQTEGTTCSRSLGWLIGSDLVYHTQMRNPNCDSGCRAFAEYIHGVAPGLAIAMGGGGERSAAGARPGSIGGAVRPPRTSGGCRSFSGDTEVLLADGSVKAIDRMEPGDLVLATDPETGQTEPRTVTRVWRHEDRLMVLHVGEHVVLTTEDHLFWSQTDRAWRQAQDLEPGDRLRGTTAPSVSAGTLDPATAFTGWAYNLTIDGIPTYYVVVSGAPVLVHNDRDASGTVFRQGGYEFVIYANDPDVPPHGHLKGHGYDIRIGQNGKPLEKGVTLTGRQQQIVDDNLREIRKAMRKKMREYNRNHPKNPATGKRCR